MTLRGRFWAAILAVLAASVCHGARASDEDPLLLGDGLATVEEAGGRSGSPDVQPQIRMVRLQPSANLSGSPAIPAKSDEEIENVPGDAEGDL